MLRFMVESRESSFRRILLSRILLLSVPVLLVGEYVTYRKARSSLLETARQNLTESAIRKGERIGEAVEALQANLITASDTAVLQSGSQEESQKFIQQLQQQLPTKIQCIQLIDLQTSKPVSSTCGEAALVTLSASLWPQQQTQLLPNRSSVRVTTLLDRSSPLGAIAAPATANGQLQLVLSAPVYNRAGELRYALSIQSSLYQQRNARQEQGSLYGSTVVIDQDGTILEHPIPERVGRNISQETDPAKRLQKVLKNALAGAQDFSHLYGFEKDNVESVVGYTAIQNPISKNPEDKWVILAVASIDNALYGLEEIKQVMLNLILGLLAANLLATLYLSRDLARPLEKLEDYALNVQGRGGAERIPSSFKIREFNHLAIALNTMVDRLTAWAEQVESAWKEAQAANQLKSEFLANTSHELRTPLNAIIGCIRLVKDGCCDDEEEEREFLQRADDAAIHLLKIINEILDLSKIEAGTLTVVTEPLDMRSLLQEVVDMQMVQLDQKGLQLHWVPPAEPMPVQADPAKLKQVVLNVVSNAIKFTDVGSIAIKMEIPSGTNTIILSVRDTGCGVPPEQQQKLFRPFVMADGTRTRKHGGTGLGLAISRKLMELMDGTINLYSPGTGKGTTVEIAMPAIAPSRLTAIGNEIPSKISDADSVSVASDYNGHGNPVLSETNIPNASKQQ
jgi:two-component system, NarL family, sensor histidine kinase BarA